jgi:hypothetical protein
MCEDDTPADQRSIMSSNASVLTLAYSLLTFTHSVYFELLCNQLNYNKIYDNF